ncbi:uncharacterized protein [Spinacia oleracea]|uniref:TF-B3 domain-containing protein n=1 Tax=Spinacia oleracea TaxID=3562 RepID=A0ABM3QNU5_SPIOL|nr:uncharacterized protein LOC130461113 [Spinacia oleracea]
MMNNFPIKKKTNEKESENPPKKSSSDVVRIPHESNKKLKVNTWMKDDNKCYKPSENRGDSVNVKVDKPLDLSLSLCCGSLKGKEKVIQKVIIKKQEEEEYYDDGDLCLALSLSPSPYFYYGTTSSSSPNNQIPEQLAVVNVNEPKWTFKKLLTASDCDKGQGRFLINNRNWVEENIIENEDQKIETKNKEGIQFNFFDWDEKRQFKSNLRTWEANSYVVYKNWKIQVLDRRMLQKGDEIGLYWDRINKMLYFTVLERNHGDQINPSPASSKRRRVSKEEMKK